MRDVGHLFLYRQHKRVMAQINTPTYCFYQQCENNDAVACLKKKMPLSPHTPHLATGQPSFEHQLHGCHSRRVLKAAVTSKIL